MTRTICCGKCDFYPRPPRGGRRESGTSLDKASPISIHALREEGDLLSSSFFANSWIFLSTPSARRATAVFWGWKNGLKISIHALREEGDQCNQGRCIALKISIHALREEGDYY